MTSLYTIGHSTLPAEKFLEILNAFGIQIVADIRTVPRSRKNPQYEQQTMQRFLPENGLEYLHVPALGGLRRARKDSVNTGWQNASFRGYADYMQTPEFAAAVDALIALAQQKRVVIMCAESVPWRCHRSLVGDALLIRGVGVEDIFSKANAKPHKLTPWARVDGLTITYPPAEQKNAR